MLATKQTALVDACGLLVALVDGIAHDELELAFTGGQRQLLSLFGGDLKCDGLYGVRLTLVLWLIDVLTIRQDLYVLQNDL